MEPNPPPELTKTKLITALRPPWQVTKDEYVGENPEVSPPIFVTNALKDAGDGNPGLSNEKVTKEFIKGCPTEETRLTYRDSAGKPVMVAEITSDNEVITLALDKGRGLLSGKAIKSIMNKLEAMGVNDTAGWLATSRDGREFMHRIKVRRAHSEGKPIPAEVLKDYPELTRQTKSKSTTPNSII